MLRVWLTLFFLLFPGHGALAVVELALEGKRPVTIDEVYWQDGTFFVAIDDVLPVFGIKGKWDSVKHIYRFSTPRGTATLSPGSHFLKVGGGFLPLSERPRFLDNRLRVPEDFVTEQLPDLLGTAIYYRNLSPREAPPAEDENTLDRLFAFLLQKKKSADSPVLRAVAIDPGHGGLDTGAIGLEDIKEKQVALAAAERLQKVLKMRLGIPVYLSRDGDYALTPQQRFEPAARSDVDALILLHAQSSLRSDPRGIALVVRPYEEFDDHRVDAVEGASMRLALSLQQSLERDGLPVTGIYAAPLVPLGRGNLPTVMVEMGYLTNADDYARLTSREGQESLALALFAGLKAFAEDRKESPN